MSFYDDVVNLEKAYLRWMTDRTVIRDFDGVIEINTPFLDRHRDGITIYARREGDHIVLTDDGYAITDLEQSGCPINTDRRTEILEGILNANGVVRRGDELTVTVSADDFPSRKNDLVNAISRVSDMYVLASSRKTSVFRSDVLSWLGSKDVQGATDVRYSGMSGFTLTADFVITRRITSKPVVLQTVQRPDVQSMANVLMMKKELDRQISNLCALVNDEGISDRTMESIDGFSENYNVPVMHWTRREEEFEMLSSL